jgi:lipopolysaccharide transport system permease protein
MFASVWKHRSLVWQLLRRDIESRYRGSFLGIFWSLVTPLLMLCLYTFIFQYVFKSRWNISDSETTLSFAMMLFIGLSIHGVTAEILTRSPSLIITHKNFVKKVVFPLEIISWTTLFSILFNFAIAFALAIAFVLLEMGRIPLTALWLPVILLPYCLLLLGISWLLSGIGVYLRDIQQITGTIATLLLFLSPVFFSIKILPEGLQSLILLNPISFVVDASRTVLVYGQHPDMVALGAYSLVSLMMLFTGYTVFNKLRLGFADVL